MIPKYLSEEQSMRMALLDAAANERGYACILGVGIRCEIGRLHKEGRIAQGVKYWFEHELEDVYVIYEDDTARS